MIKNAPSGAVNKIAHTATVNTIFPQDNPIAKGIEPRGSIIDTAMGTTAGTLVEA